MKRLGDVLKQKGVTRLAFTPFNKTYVLAGRDLPPLSPMNPGSPSPGWNAVSVTLWKVFRFPVWADTAPEPTGVGKSILLWYFPSVPKPVPPSSAFDRDASEVITPLTSRGLRLLLSRPRASPTTKSGLPRS